MSKDSSVVFVGIAPHPPIMVPEVGRDAIVDVRLSIDAMAELTSRVIRGGAETIILISPHAPLERNAFVAYESPELRGDFANFRAPAETVGAPLDEELLAAISSAAAAQDLAIVRLKRAELDHGTIVPLYFLKRYGWQGRLVALGYSFLSDEAHVAFGNCIRKAVDSVGRTVAFIASGDLSHRLQPGAPAGFNPEAHFFDEAVLDAIHNCLPERIVNLDPELRRNAGECGYRSMLTAIGVAAGSEPNCEVISYEAPFGVGYLVAQLCASGKMRSSPSALAGGSTVQVEDPSAGAGEDLPALARRVVEAFVSKGEIVDPPPDRSELLKHRAACFVSIKTRKGELRGCIGTFEPAQDSLAEELIHNAVGAATKDPRFAPITASELPDLKYSVDVLAAPEPATVKDLDPEVYGVIVEDGDGLRGLLLPNLQGVNTAEKQIEIACRKAGIRPGAKFELWRFRTARYREESS